jgi:hypothetical protein
MQAAVAQTLTAAPTATPLPTATATPTPTMTPTPVLVSYGPNNFPENVDPLTGLQVADPSILNRRPVLVKVADQQTGRPHAGLSNADIVFDYYVGGGLDRFLALYYGKDDEKVGTVRSGRLIDIPLVQMYQGILGMVSADNNVHIIDGNTELVEILEKLGDRVINTEHCDENYKAICRMGPTTDETTVFANTAEMTKLFANRTGTDNAKQNLDGMAFATLAPAGGSTATQFTMHYGKNADHQWVYDPASKKFLQWTSMEDYSSGVVSMVPLIDRNTGNQLVFSNVIVVFAQVNSLNGAQDSIHEQKFANRDGRALVFRDGKMYDVFYKTAWNQPISFYDSNGNPFAFQPGNSWIHVAGNNSVVTEDSAGVWMVKFGMP